MFKSASYSLILLLALATPAGLANNEQAQLEELTRKINRIQKQLSKQEKNRDQTTRALRKTELKLAELTRHAQTLSTRLRTLGEDLKRLQTQRSALKTRQVEQQQHLTRELAAAYRLATQEPLRVLFNLEQPSQLSRTLKYHEYVFKARQNALESYRATLAELDTTERALAATRIELKDASTRNTANRRDIEHQAQQRQALLTTINAAIDNDQVRLDKLRSEYRQLEKLLADISAQITHLEIPANQPFAKQRGKLPWPSSAKPANRFGSSRGRGIKWQGWLLPAQAGGAIQAIYHGRVIFSDYLRGQGLLLIIDHGDGFLSLYGHNQMLLKGLGDWVSAGETLARAGNSGGLDKPALYFEIRHRGRALNPSSWLRPRT